MSKERISSVVNGERLWDRHMQLAQIGATSDGGVDRQALSENDIQARALVIRWAEHAGLSCEVDPIGNIFMRSPGSDSQAHPVVSGSHIDTQPNGGRFDGIYGVLAALEVLEAANEAGIRTKRPIEAVIWTNEEGSRFAPGLMGSRVFVQPDQLSICRQVVDSDNISVAEELHRQSAQLPHVRRRSLGGSVSAYVEAHIEQGPVLEQSDCTIGVVTGIPGVRHFMVEIVGESAHAGTMPRHLRKDALSTAIALIGDLENLFYKDDDEFMRFTVGRLVVWPNSSSVVPDRVSFSIDFRNPNEEKLQLYGDRVYPLGDKHSRICKVHIEEVVRRRTVKFDDTIQNCIWNVSTELGLSSMSIYSGAAHDAQYLTEVCPSGMIFIPCRNGISHNPKESIDPNHAIDGARVLADVLATLAND